MSVGRERVPLWTGAEGLIALLGYVLIVTPLIFGIGFWMPERLWMPAAIAVSAVAFATYALYLWRLGVGEPRPLAARASDQAGEDDGPLWIWALFAAWSVIPFATVATFFGIGLGLDTRGPGLWVFVGTVVATYEIGAWVVLLRARRDRIRQRRNGHG